MFRRLLRALRLIPAPEPEPTILPFPKAPEDSSDSSLDVPPLPATLRLYRAENERKE